MKKIIVLVICLMCVLTACKQPEVPSDVQSGAVSDNSKSNTAISNQDKTSTNEDETNKLDSNEASTNEEEADKADSNDNILISVLHNENFLITEKGETVYMKDYKPLYKYPEDTDYYQSENLFAPCEYAFVDLDKDGQNELIISELPDADTYLILHKSNDKIYGYSLYVRWFQSLKSDGTFLSSGGAFSHDYNTINFDENKYNISTFATFDFVGDEKPSSNRFGCEPDYEKSVFEIDGKKVSFEKIEEFAEEWDKRPNAEWIQIN